MTAAYQTRPRPQVTAVVVTGGRSPYLPQALWCLARQTRPAETTLLVCTDQAAVAEVQEMALMCGLTAATLQVVAAPKAKNFGQAVAGGLATAGLDGAGLQGTAADAAGVDSFLWLLHDDCYPEPGALEALAAALELGPSVALAGPKQVRPEDPRLLEEVGCSTTPFGRRLANGDNGELDQGQYDANDDVLAVGTAGLLVRLAAWRHLGGLDPALGPYRDGLDLSRRARLAGYRVVVAPEAVMGHEKASYLGLRPTGRSGRRGACSGQHASGSTKAQARREPNPAASFAPRRRALIFTQLVHGPVWALPLVTVAAIASAIGRFFWRLATKDFRLAAAELAAPVAVLARPGRVFASRRLAARTARAARRSLRPLQLSAREARALRRDRRITAAEHLRLRQAPTEIEIAELRALAARRRRMFAALAVVV
ncbi:MAG: glycosyltransferase, partial [Bifidobacteriaceae bacterium]|nr:glycosyltransferase [Bifidobacteriaceae bacterium]